MKEKRTKILIIGPLSPPKGGVANFIENITKTKTLNENYDVKIYRVGKRNRETPDAIAAILELSRILKLPFNEAFRSAEIVHIHSSSFKGFYYNSLYLVVAKMLNKKVVFHYHGAKLEEFYYHSNPLTKIIIRKVFHIADNVVVTAEKWKRLIAKMFGRTSRIIVVYNGYDPRKFPLMEKEKARERLNLPIDKKIIFGFSNLYPVKGYEYLIEAMKTVINHRNDVICFIGGGGPLKEKLQEQINSLDLQNHVKLLGFVPNEELPLWMSAADLFAHPSLGEGNPTVMFEALGVGLPFVGTAVGGVPEIITSDDYGLLCKPGDPQDLAEKILIALDKEWDREQIRKYAEQFTWENIARRVVRVYLEVLRSE